MTEAQFNARVTELIEGYAARLRRALLDYIPFADADLVRAARTAASSSVAPPRRRPPAARRGAAGGSPVPGRRRKPAASSAGRGSPRPRHSAAVTAPARINLVAAPEVGNVAAPQGLREESALERSRAERRAAILAAAEARGVR